MRLLSLSLLFFSIPLILIGCSDGNEEPDLITEHPTRLDTTGEFYRYKEVKDIGTYETGPITITIDSAETVNGTLSDTFRVSDEEREMDMVNVLMKFELNNEVQDKLIFNEEENLHMSVNTEEKILEPDSFMSSMVDIKMLKWTRSQEGAPFLRQFTFILEESTAQEVEQATLLIDGPVDSEGNAVGEDLEIEIDFIKRD